MKQKIALYLVKLNRNMKNLSWTLILEMMKASNLSWATSMTYAICWPHSALPHKMEQDHLTGRESNFLSLGHEKVIISWLKGCVVLLPNYQG